MNTNEKRPMSRPTNDVPPKTLFVRVVHDDTNVRYILRVIDRLGEGYPDLLDRSEQGTFNTLREAARAAEWLAERLREMGHTASVLD